MAEYIAHISEGRIQTVREHLLGTAELAGQFGSSMRLEKETEHMAKYHDAGKLGDDFQAYILGKHKGRVDHSTAGAQLLYRQRDKLGVLATLLALCIAGHHCGIPDLGNSKTDMGSTSTFYGRMKKQVTDIRSRLEVFDVSGINDLNASNINRFISKSDTVMDIMLLTRMLYSCLVDADFLDTERFMNPMCETRGQFPSIEKLAEKFFAELDKRGYFTPKNKLNAKRCEILQTCRAKGKGDSGLYTLTVPTGGGKTISSMAFAMEQAVTHHKKRIIYVIPYISIIDQTAGIFKDILGNDVVLEDHSQVNYEISEEDEGTEKSKLKERMKLASENWDVPIVITTSEKFWESLYSNRSSKCRKLHNLVDSIIIIDEAQMLPVDFLKPCLCALQELVAYYGCISVLCSATQPALDKYVTRVKTTEIMENIPELYNFFKRVSFHIDGEKTYEEVAEEIQKCRQVLCVASTKKEAEQIYGLMDGKNTYYLSTNLCPAHRKRVIGDIKRQLSQGSECRVISTSIISVGVDIDFPVVWLEYTGLDALIQGAGRCNREGKRCASDSIAHVFWTEKGKASPFMDKEKGATDVAVSQFDVDEITSPEAIRLYFSLWYQSNQGNLDYKEIEKWAKQLAYAKIGKIFRLIPDETKSVFIPWDDHAKELHDRLKMGIRTRALMREAGQYMVAVRYMANSHAISDFSELLNRGAACMYPNDTELAYLADESLYDPICGLKIPADEGDAIMW